MSTPERSADASSGPGRRDAWDLGAIIAAEVAQPRAKRPWQSRTYWFIGISLVAKFIVLVPGLSGLEIDVGATTDIILLCLSFFADIGALWGRNKAQRPITWRSPGALSGAAVGGMQSAGPAPAPPDLPPDALGDPAGYWRAGRGSFHDS